MMTLILATDFLKSDITSADILDEENCQSRVATLNPVQQLTFEQHGMNWPVNLD